MHLGQRDEAIVLAEEAREISLTLDDPQILASIEKLLKNFRNDTEKSPS